MSRTIHLNSDAQGERLDCFLSRQLPQLSRSAVQRLLEDGRVRQGEQVQKKSSRTAPGACYTVCLPEPEPMAAQAEPIPLEIVFEDEDVLVVNKPVGLVVHPAPGHAQGTLVNGLLYHCGESLSGINGVLRPGIVHRIDRDTSGLLLAAKNDRAHLSLCGQLKNHSLCRIYEAIVTGQLKEDAGTVSQPIGRSGADRKKMAVTCKNGRPAVTHWQVLGRYPGHTHVQCRLETGRTHQIRVHMAFLGHPLLGDVAYGRKKPVPGLAGQCLHARELSFVHPSTGERITVICPLPEWFRAQLTRLGQGEPSPWRAWDRPPDGQA